MAQLKKILLVDDDDDLREALSEQLVMTEDFDVFEAATGPGRPDQDQGRALRPRDPRRGPPRHRRARARPRDEEAGREVPDRDAHGPRHRTPTRSWASRPGANDYVTKPFKFPVLLARIRAQLRTHEQSEDAIFQLGPYTFRPAQKLLLTEDEKKVRLTEKETNILKFLYRAQDAVVPRDVLLHEVWGYNAGVTTHTLETHIYRLRQKIEPDPSNARLLVTESGGYRLVA